jgi:hypothetical protein
MRYVRTQGIRLIIGGLLMCVLCIEGTSWTQAQEAKSVDGAHVVAGTVHIRI